jgi:NADH dehydrogenase
MKVVIVGGGFAGVRAALNLSKNPESQVTLISDRPCFEYHAALYRTSTGRSVLEVSVMLEQIFEGTGVNLVEDKISTIDPTKKTITGSSGSRYQYDKAILALGSVTAYFGIKGLQEFSFSLKSVDEALALRNHLHRALVAGDAELNYVVVGAGPSGVELAGELVAYLRKIRKHHRIDRPFSVALVEAAPRVLPSLPESVSRKVDQRLKHLGVKIFTSTAVKAETADDLQLPEGSIQTHTVIWTAGITGNPFFEANKGVFKLAKGNRVEVDDRLVAAPDVYVLGDSAATAQSGWAQTAIYDGDFVSQAISGKESTHYQPPQPIGAIPVGQKWCVVSGRRRQASGYFGWLVRRWLDWQIFSAVLPGRLALKTWFYGTKREESCEICR